jgi:hypothetical protein
MSASCSSVHDLAAASERHGGLFERCHFLHLRFFRLYGLVAGSNGVRRHAVPFLYVPVRAPAVGGPILPIAGRVR